MPFDLHRTENSDWDFKPDHELTKVQKLAKTTHGIVTPGNPLTLIGLGLVLDGAQRYKNGSKIMAVIEIALGRLSDYFDGQVAHQTGTKSQTGELVDIVADKIGTLGIISTLISEKILSRSIIGFFVGQNSTNTAIGIKSKLNHEKLHSSKKGKIATFLQSAYFSSALIGHTINEKQFPKTKKALNTSIKVFGAITIACSMAATYDYINEAKKSNQTIEF